MTQKLFALMLALTLTATWLGVSAAQPTTGQVLRVATATVLPDKRDQLPKIVEDLTQLCAATKNLLWFKVGSDPATGEEVTVTLWNSQAEAEAFVNSDARKSTVEKIRPLLQGEASFKTYHVAAAKSAAQHSATGQVLRVFTTIVLPDKRDQLPKIAEDLSPTIAAAKGVLWFKVGSDATTGEIVVVSLWSSQAEIEAFLKSDVRKASIEKTRPLMQGEPSAKNYQVSEAKK
jgi:quinol monooxygenase YgiN